MALSDHFRPVLYVILCLSALLAVSLIGYDQVGRKSFTGKASKDSGLVLGRNPTEKLSIDYDDEEDKSISKLLLQNIIGDNIVRNLRQLTKKPHRAGTEGNRLVGEWIRDQWKSQGLSDVHFAEYDVLLSQPADYDHPNTVEILDKSGQLIFQSIGQMPPLVPEEQSDYGANFTFNAYSASGTVTGRLVYVNYARGSDLDELEKRNITLKGKIAIARYGEEWRGAKALEVQRRGAIGLIIFSDPAEVCPNITDQAQTYPHSIWMPQGGVQLGSLMNYHGDPLTPLYPAVDYTYRSKNIDDLLAEEALPSIPVQPIGYGDAYEFLSRLEGEEAPPHWQGGLNITYRFDQGEENDSKIRLTVRTNTSTGKIRDVIGFIEGRSEPDRYVIIGNHYDAWIYGAIDPNSGTATMLEISRAFMKVINETGWRPRRTIVFCAWDSEEQGLLGSSEWVQQYATILDRRGVAYLNVDLISGNESIFVSGNPTLYGTTVKAAKRVQNPDPDEIKAGRKSLFDTWIRKYPPDVVPGVPSIPSPRGGSDHVSFFSYTGIPILDFRYKNLTNDTSGGYALYHTLYETVFLEEQLEDPNHFAFHVATGQFWAEMTRILANANLLPLNVDDYAVVIKSHLGKLNDTLKKIGLVPKMKPLVKDLGSLSQAVDVMLQRADKFHYHGDQLRRSSTTPDSLFISASFEMFNSRLQQVERCFLNPRGDPDNPEIRHVIYGVDVEDVYASTQFPFIYKQLAKYNKAKDDQERTEAYNGLREQISIVHYSVECATSLLKKFPVSSF